MGALSQRFALVTGGSRGIGRGIVQRLASDGAVVAFSYVKDGSAAEEVERVVARAGGNARGFAADLSQMSEVRTLFNDAEEWLGRLDIVVLNAGVAVGGPIEEVTEEMYDRVMDVNAKATFFGIQEAGRRLRDGGRIITMSSSNTVLVEPGASVYSASKAAIEQVSGIAARELGARAITVNIVSPRVTNTDGLGEGMPDRRTTTMAEVSALGPLGGSEDVANVVAFLVGPEGRWITGQNLRASGGFT